jgi:hypothetical protein
MKKARLLLPLFLLVVSPMAGSGQVEHAATPEQCRADADAWGIPQWSILMQNQNQFAALSNNMRNGTITAKVLEARNAEFAQCERTDSSFSGRYVQANRAYVIAELARMAGFMQRHNLMAQFYQDDEQGQR